MRRRSRSRRPARSCWRSRSALAAAAPAGILIEFLVIRRLYARDHIQQVLATFGLILFLNEGLTISSAASRCSIGVPPALSGAIEIIPGVPYPLYRIVIIVVGLLVAAGLYLLHRQYPRRNAGARGLDAPRHGARARRRYPAALHDRVRPRRAARRSRRLDGRTALRRSGRHGRADPDSDLCRGRDRRRRLGPRRVFRRADRRGDRHVAARFSSRLAARRHDGFRGRCARPAGFRRWESIW